MVADPRTVPSLEGRVSGAEWALRVDLAACCRLIADHGWDELAQTHASARLPDGRGYLVNPFGVHYFEVNASSLVEVDLEGRVASAGPYSVNPAVFAAHGAIYRSRPDVHSVLHTHTVAGVCVATQRAGLLPLTQTALFFFRNNLAYHDYAGVTLDAEEGLRIAADLGTASSLILRNHGLLVAEPSIRHAFTTLYYLERACAMQVALQSSGAPTISLDIDVQTRVGRQLESYPPEYRLTGQLEWPGLLRRIDAADPSFRR